MDILVQNFQAPPIISSQKHKAKAPKQTFRKNNSVTTHEKLNLLNSRHGQLLVKKSSINFKGEIPSPPRNRALEKKISSILQVFGKDDVILVGKDIKESKALLKKSLSAVKGAIRKVFFVQEDKMEGAIALHQNELGLKSVINLNNENLPLDSSVRTTFIKEGQSAFLTDYEDIITPQFKFGIKDSNETNLAELRTQSVKEFDFSHKDDAAIRNLNSKHLDVIAPDETDISTTGGRKIKFKDIGGQDEAIKEIKKSILYPIKYPNAYKNQIINRGIILEGPPGTGKTLLAEALANEADAHFIGINGLEMESKWVGESEENWRDLFKEAKDNSPTIIFIDEFDAVARSRGEGPSGGNKHDDKVVNQLLTLMSDVEKGKYGNTFVIVTTNKVDLLDEAITRSGRFGKKISMKAPQTVKDCLVLFDIHTKNKPLADDIDKDEFAKKLLATKATGADVAHITGEAYQNSLERLGINEKMENDTLTDEDLDKIKIETSDLEKALDEFRAQRKNPKEGRIMGFKRP